MNWSDVLSGDPTSRGGRAAVGRVHPARQTRRVLGVAGASCFASLVWVISAEAETPVSYNVTAALQPPAPLVASNAPAPLQLDGGATPATAAPVATTVPGATGPAPTGPAPTAAPAATAAPAQTAAPATTAPPADGGGGGEDHGGDHGGIITIPPTTNGSFDTSSGGS